ncbi:LysM peptidoglycan-binding domain-containing protein [Winogradskyella sp.]|uniref:LysM peptidoglycan-binding domain-containing protein n=1 Tax=Winogradskyella sp. TaxID=1883156 RepID=UPI00263A0A3C|nr:LysM peptidoglycan-binding domain-containing protein [Winogradskyella sp.]
MRRSYRLFLSIIVVLLFGFLAFAQETPNYKDVLLDGKPAKLNIDTGEITLVSEMNQNNLEQKDSLVVRKQVIKDSIVTNLESDFHTVKDKETLLDIANKYGTTLTELKRLNNLETTLVNKGQIIRLRDIDLEMEKGLSEIKDSEVPEPEISKNPSNETIYNKSSSDFHTVEKGQTLYSLAKLYGLTVNDLKRYNGLTSNLIKTGQELRIANFDAQAIQEQSSVWTVVKGDTLYSIAKKNGLTVDELKRINKLTSNLIFVGQKLQLK